MLNDRDERIKATDPHASYIVQAPAGSGKTEILTQRFLRLLSGVHAPEQIIALTFTRKAANEMRERILRALYQAANQINATSAHQQQTLAFATEALARDKAQKWQLIEQPGRLRIITIDSLCQTITHAIPLQEKQIPYANITDKPQRHYKAAARACFNFAVEHKAYQPALKNLLQHVDNRQDILLDLFGALLANRDQWQRFLYQAKEQDKSTYEEALAFIEQHELTRFHNSIPNDLAAELITLVSRLADIQSNPDALLRQVKKFSDLDRTLTPQIAAMILTSQNTLRKAFDHHVGLKRGDCSDSDYHDLKMRSQVLLSQLVLLPDFLPALIRVKNLPEPHYDAEQWAVLQSLFTLLPLLSAHLQVVFIEQNEVDFTAISEQALQALGDDDNPTDLSLYLDNSIHHLLVDEFQDTSIQQFQLLSQLVQGFTPNDGKTLFVVGDPMQSIYRFRSAEVGLFLRAKQQGIGPVKLIPLELSSNFRSTSTLVDWVNDQFKTIFPPTNDIESGAVSFHPSFAVKGSDKTSQVMAFQYENRKDEAAAIVNLIATELKAHPTDEIAILVRSRLQLLDIIQGLKEHQIPFQGVDINLLAKLPHLRDIWSLTQALMMPANRLAWLSLLRSPWCGLSLTDLHCIAIHENKQSIYFALSQLDQIIGLSDDGRLRAKFIYTVLDAALATRHQQPLIHWISDTLKHLHIEKILSPSEQDDVAQFWLLLERFEHQGQIDDISGFNQELNQLYSQQVIPSRLKIMTIHKSKGLEFDCVILPGLGLRPPSMDSPLLRWLKLPSQHHETLLLLSPLKAAHQEQCLLYDYLGKLDAEKNDYELQRLLYVAATRAKKRLYLFDYASNIGSRSFRSLLPKQEFITTQAIHDGTDKRSALPPLYQLPIEWYQTPYLCNQKRNTTPLMITNTIPRLTGIVAHELLQWTCDHHPSSMAEVPWELAYHQFKALGFEGSALEMAIHQLKRQLKGLFDDPIGQWLIQSHEDERNEYEILVHEQGTLNLKIIDRTFCYQGTRWIIDFKTGHDDKINESRHRQQVNDYARLFNERDHSSIRCGLYYLASNRWLDWEYINT